MTPNTTSLDCCAEWHLWRRGAQLAIYQKIAQVTNGGEKPWFGLEQTLTDFFGIDYVYGAKQFRALAKEEWLKKLPLSAAEEEMERTGIETDAALASLKRNKFQHKKYRWISHDEWVVNHPGTCFVKPTYTWSNDNLDPLGPMLYSVSEGLKWFPSMYVSPRAVFGSDEAVVKAFVTFVEHLPQRPYGKRQWKAAQLKFCHQCAEQAKAVPDPVAGL
jgi:hypothetical protein